MRHRTACILALLLPGAGPAAAQDRTWYLSNEIACYQPEPNSTICGPALRIPEGSGNGTMISGYVLVQAAGRVWTADTTYDEDRSFGFAGWKLHVAQTSTVAQLHWIMGSWDFPTATFTPAPGPETDVVLPGDSSWYPIQPFVVPAGQRVALFLRDTSGGGSLVDIYNEAPGGNSPSWLDLLPSGVTPAAPKSWGRVKLLYR